MKFPTNLNGSLPSFLIKSFLPNLLPPKNNFKNLFNELAAKQNSKIVKAGIKFKPVFNESDQMYRL
jgi:hypothetical protein